VNVVRPIDAKYWASAQALQEARVLQDAATLSAAPTKPESWNTHLHEEFGLALGRVLAHEARHRYFTDPDGHAATGLGASDVGDQAVAERPAYRQFSADGRKNLLAAIGRQEKNQRGTTLVATFPETRRAHGFPF
jgi:hypothetical protein